MISFAVFGLPRSGTTWAANWLTDGGALCLHDPIAEHAPEAVPGLDIGNGRVLGVSCTGLWLFDVLPDHVPVVILERDPVQSNAELVGMGLAALPDWMHDRFARVRGLRVPFADLWAEDGARRIWSHLRPVAPFDVLRWRMLRDIQVQPFMDRMRLCEGSAEAFRRLVINQ